ncbi:MAG: cardiolipin synthase [Sphaerochaetaceae bacterium]
MRQHRKLVSGRLVLSILFILIQVLFLCVALFYSIGASYYVVGSTAISIILGLYIASRDDNPAYQVGWLLVLVAIPFFGLMFYLIFGNKGLGKWSKKKFGNYRNLATKDLFPLKEEKIENLKNDNLERIALYIKNQSGYGLFSNTAVKYYPLGELGYPHFLDGIRLAKKYIFFEFFIYNDGELWREVKNLLLDKVKEGVAVYLMYDDMGSINYVPTNFDILLRKQGIKAVKFNPVHPRMNPKLNFRDHRKMCVVDGKIAFTGGLNMADEYINRNIKFGHWKDNFLKLEGLAVSSFVVTFIDLWNFASPIKMHLKDEDFITTYMVEGDGYVQPFADSPLDYQNVSEFAYMQVINLAKKYVWITTPYLILDNEMINALSLAAYSGVDVRIITPYVPDKILVFEVTQANYKRLIEAGVKIYQYVPGFIHTKIFICDDQISIVGTTNMDYRSFYLHFELGVIMFKNEVIKDVKKDVNRVIELSKPVTLEEINKLPRRRKLFRSFLKLFAPMM